MTTLPMPTPTDNSNKPLAATFKVPAMPLSGEYYMGNANGHLEIATLRFQGSKVEVTSRNIGGPDGQMQSNDGRYEGDMDPKTRKVILTRIGGSVQWLILQLSPDGKSLFGTMKDKAGKLTEVFFVAR